MTHEQQLLHAAKFALASLKLNGLDQPGELHWTAQMLERAIANYGPEHVDEINAYTRAQNMQMEMMSRSMDIIAQL